MLVWYGLGGFYDNYMLWLGIGWFNLLIILWWSVGVIWIKWLVIVCEVVFRWLVSWIKLDYYIEKIVCFWIGFLLVWFGEGCSNDWWWCGKVND